MATKLVELLICGTINSQHGYLAMKVISTADFIQLIFNARIELEHVRKDCVRQMKLLLLLPCILHFVFSHLAMAVLTLHLSLSLFSFALSASVHF